jgi:hypothetical protein
MLGSFTFELTHEQADGVVVAALRDIRETLVRELDNNTQHILTGDSRVGIFDTKPKKDRKAIKKHLKAVDLLLAYWGEKP